LYLCSSMPKTTPSPNEGCVIFAPIPKLIVLGYLIMPRIYTTDL
jgi:hypothetical protein